MVTLGVPKFLHKDTS